MTLREFFDWLGDWFQGIGAFLGEVFSLVFQQTPWMDASIFAVIVAIIIYLTVLNYGWISVNYAYRRTFNVEFKKEQEKLEEEDALYGNGKLAEDNNTKMGCGTGIVGLAGVLVVLWILSPFV